MTLKKQEKYNITLIVANFLLLFILCYEARFKSLWLDDIAQINMVGKNVSVDQFINNIMEQDNNPPLSHFITAIWVRISPYGNFWIKLPGIIFCLIGANFCALLMKKLKGDLYSIFTFLCVGFSYSLVVEAAFVVRPYGLLFMLSSILIYVLYERNRSNCKKIWLVLYGILMLLLAYTHYFGCLFIFSFFVTDIYLMIKKRIGLKVIVSYVFLIGFIPWILLMFQKYIGRDNTFWPAPPSFLSIIDTIQRLCGESRIVFVGFVFVIVLMFIEKKVIKENEDFLLYQIIAIAITIICPFFYSAVINPKCSLFVERYFIVLVPSIYILSIIGLANLLDKLNDNYKIKKSIALLLLFFIVITNYRSIYTRPTIMEEKFGDSAEFIMSQEDVYNSNVAIFNTSYANQIGWNYYLTQNGKRKGKNAFFRNQIQSFEDVKDIDKIYYIKLHSEPDEIMLGIINSEFELTYTDINSGVLVYTRVNKD